MRGFTLVEAIVVIIIIGVLAAVIAPRLIGRVGEAKTKTAESGAAVLAGQMRLFMTDCGRIPDGATIMVLWEAPAEVAKESWKGPYVESKDALNDPWGKPFLLVVPATKNVDFDIVSYGLDGKPGGDGENADIVKP